MMHNKINDAINTYFDELVWSNDVSFQHLRELRAHDQKAIVTCSRGRARAGTERDQGRKRKEQKVGIMDGKKGVEMDEEREGESEEGGI